VERRGALLREVRIEPGDFDRQALGSPGVFVNLEDTITYERVFIPIKDALADWWMNESMLAAELLCDKPNGIIMPVGAFREHLPWMYKHGLHYPGVNEQEWYVLPGVKYRPSKSTFRAYYEDIDKDHQWMLYRFAPPAPKVEPKMEHAPDRDIVSAITDALLLTVPLTHETQRLSVRINPTNFEWSITTTCRGSTWTKKGEVDRQLPADVGDWYPWLQSTMVAAWRQL